jgi:hypothetical protein
MADLVMGIRPDRSFLVACGVIYGGKVRLIVRAMEAATGISNDSVTAGRVTGVFLTTLFTPSWHAAAFLINFPQESKRNSEENST